MKTQFFFEHRTPVFIVITHAMPKLFQKCKFFQIFLYFCTHDLQGASQSAKIVTDTHSITKKLKNKCDFFK